MENEEIVVTVEENIPAEEIEAPNGAEPETSSDNEGAEGTTTYGEGEEDAAETEPKEEESGLPTLNYDEEPEEEEGQLMHLVCPICGEVFFEAYTDEGSDISAICPVCTNKILGSDDASAAAVEVMLSGLRDQAEHAEQHHADEIEALKASYEERIRELEHRISEMDKQHAEELQDQQNTLTSRYEKEKAAVKDHYSRSLNIISDFIAKVK